MPRQIGGFEILDSLGQGGMGVVYRARDNTLQRELAIKLQIGDWQNNPEMLQRFLREAKILAKINHPNVVHIFSVGEHEGAPFFVMELLESSIADAARTKIPSIPQLKRWMLEAARGLAAIHETGVIHRDIKPGNLLLTKATSVEEEHVKVADLGIASAGELFGARLTRAGSVLGTTGYLAPEAFRVEHTLDGRADQYSLGIVFYELLARRGPFQDMSDTAMVAAIFQPRTAPDVREFRPEVDVQTAQILARMLASDPNQRFATTPELVHALQQVQGTNAQVISAATVKMTAVPPSISSMPKAAPVAASPSVKASNKTWLTLASAFVVLSLVGYLVLHKVSAPLPSTPTATTKPMPAAERAFPPTSDPAKPAETLDQLKRVSAAKYLLSRYILKTKAEPVQTWTLDLIDQNSGVIDAELTGPEEETVELTGRVESQENQTFDGVDWEIYQVKLLGADGTIVEVRFEFSESATDGAGYYLYDEKRQQFRVESFQDL